MSKKTKRQKAIKRLNLSDHTLGINIRKCNYNRFNFSEVEEYVRELAGVVHMATGTGKSYVIFAIAWLSLVMGLTKRVLVLGPSSTIIEQGLREKFKDLMSRKYLNDKLPAKYRGKAINLLTDNDPIEDDSIVIENINAVYTFGGITDTLFKNTNEALVLGDEIHHAYSHLKYADNRLVLDREAGAGRHRINKRRTVVDDRYPEENEIRQVILEAMEDAGIKGNRLSEENRKQIDNYFNQFLPRGKKKRVFENIEGDIMPVDTSRMERSGIRVSELERDRTAFLSEDYETEAGEANQFILDYIHELRKRSDDGPQLSLFKPEDFVERRDEISNKNPHLLNHPE